MELLCLKRKAVATLLAVPTMAFAWGYQGHEVIGAIADRMLHETAKTQVRQILGFPLEVAARWPDCAKDVEVTHGEAKYIPMEQYHAACAVFETTEGIQRMEDYVARNFDNCSRDANKEPCHKQYHYTDVNYQHSEYQSSYVGTSDHDVVHAINAAVAVLRGESAPAPFDIKDKTEALLLLAHFVGDIHQPLHVGAVYLDTSGEMIDPDQMHPFDPATETRGGNSIIVGTTGNLHATWDNVSKNLLPPRISKELLDEARQVPNTSGPVSGWATVWASDTLAAARKAFSAVRFSEGDRSGQWIASFKNRSAYLRTKNRVQRGQLVKAGARLAHILNDIWH